MLNDRQIIRYNPWWTEPGWEASDAHLRRLASQPVQLPSPQVHEVDLTRPAVHILRGPRQVGKSTDLKLLVRRALAEGYAVRQVVYLSLDLLEDQRPSELVDTIVRAFDLAGAQQPPRLLALDEVTSADGWRTSVKAMWDEGQLDTDVVICTGSSATDLAQGAVERLPGRRGPGRDLLVLPQDFGAFARATDPSIPAALGLTIAQTLSDDGRAALKDARVHLPAMQRALERYMVFGGLPAAVAEAIAGEPNPTDEVQRILWDSLIKEVQRKGATVPSTQALLERVMRSLGSKVSWNRMASEMDVPLRLKASTGSSQSTDPRTLHTYIELLAINYFALVLYFWKQDSGTGDLSKDKKLYFGDPLLQTITAERVGLARDTHADVENAIALALYRRYEPSERISENMTSPEHLHVWGTRKGGEIDFVCGPRDAIEVVEVADWQRVNRQKATAPMRALPGRPAVVATRNEMKFGPTANMVPAALLLWALSDRP